MKVRSTLLAFAAFSLLATNTRAENYFVDAAHSGATFRASHVGLSWIPGRFNDISGTFSVDAKQPTTAQFELTAKVDSIDTNNAKRDGHLKSPDFFDAKQFPTITFKSTAAKQVDGGLEVTGDFTMHGVTKSMTVVFRGGKTAEFPKGVQRTGYTADFTIKRSDFGMGKMIEMLGDEVPVQISFEGTKK